MAKKGKKARARRPSVRALINKKGKKEQKITHIEDLQLALRYQAAGHLGQAEQVLQGVLSRKANHGTALKLLGRLYFESGRIKQGIACLERSIECQPAEFETYTELGHVLRVTGQREGAERYLRKGLDLRPSDPESHYELGCLYHDQTQLELASGELNLALKLKPEHLGARQRLGEVHQAVGQTNEAESCFRRVIETSPHDSEAHRSLAYLKRFTEYDDDIRSIETSYEKASDKGMDRIVLAFSLGKVCEDLQRYDQSFAYFEEANRLHRSHYQFAIDQEAAYFDTYREVFTTDWFDDVKCCAIEDDTPIFVLGMPRSGTSLVEQILASHSEVYGAGEVYHFDVFHREVEAITGKSFPQAIGTVPSDVLEKSARTYVEKLREGADQSRRITDKLPHNFLRVALLAAIMSKASIVHCVRDPMDTCLSVFTHFFSSAHGYGSDLRELGLYYRLYEQLMQDWASRFPGCMHTVSYERLIADPEQEIRQLLDYCGLPFESACLRFHETQRVVNTPSAVQVRQPLYSTAVSRWKRYKKHLQPLQRALAEGNPAGTGSA